MQNFTPDTVSPEVEHKARVWAAAVVMAWMAVAMVILVAQLLLDSNPECPPGPYGSTLGVWEHAPCYVDVSDEAWESGKIGRYTKDRDPDVSGWE